MKYPQLVSMPSAVQDWLEEQLESRGIDAVVYTRYVVSLLKRDTLDLPDDTIVLEPNKAKEAGRRTQSRKRGRRDECWDVLDCEQLKRSAAVECLMSASDQKCGIEKLVDDLCVKLKEIEGENQRSVYLELSETASLGQDALMPSQSPRDQAQKYYAAFPPLTSKNLAAQVPDSVSVWGSGKRVLSDVFGKIRSENTLALNKTADQNIWEEDKENLLANNAGNNTSWKEVARDNSKSRDLLKERFQTTKSYRREAEFAWSMAGNMNESYDELNSLMGDKPSADELPRRLYQRQADGEGFHDNEIIKPTLEDRNLAQLIAKFDESIEALWSPTDEAAAQEPPPINFQQLLSSPSPIEQMNIDRQPANSFIPCGTNITSSIWSDCSDIAVDTSGTEDSLLTADGRAFVSLVEAEHSKNYELLFETAEKPLTEETKIAWSESDALPSFFSSDQSFAMDYALGDFSQNIATQKWSDFKGSDMLGNYSFGKTLPDTCDGFGRSDAAVRFMALNHSKEDSSFTEVIPKLTLDGQRSDLDMMMESMKTNLGDEDSKLRPLEAEDEDLLTSARTHFKPIKQEVVDSQNGSIRGYADGTTFIIPDGLEVLPFKRSRSGTLYLETDARLETPAKYREYKEKEPYGGRCPSSVGGSPVGSEFIPKFKVCRNEKCCQTEEVLLEAESVVTIPRNEFYFPEDEGLAETLSEEKDCISCSLHQVDYLAPFVQADFKCLDHVVNKTVVVRRRKDLSQAWKEEQNECKCSNNNTAMAADWTWGVGEQSVKPWPDIWSSSSTSCQDCSSVAVGESGGWSVDDRLREELTQDGEQLLSDLSYMQHLFLGSDWLEESRDQDEEEESNRPSAQKFQCISPPCEDNEVVMYAEDEGGCSRSLPGKHLAREETPLRFEAKSVDDFFSKCLLNVLPKTILLSADLEAKWKLNERPFNAQVNSKYRKRRHSGSQRVASHEPLQLDVTVRAQTSCVRGLTCPQFILDHARALRPVTL